MNRTYAKRIIAGTLALTCALGGMYIGTARTARAAVSALPQQAGGSQAQLGPARKGSQDEHGERAEERAPAIVGEAASVLGIGEAELTRQLQAGKSLADIAKERGMNEADLTQKLMQLRIARIDEAIKGGKLDAAKGENMKLRMRDHLGHMIHEKNLLEERAGHKGRGWKPNPEQLSAILGISKDELHKQLQAGKSLADIAAAQGMSRKQLIATLKEQMTPQLERWIDRKVPAQAAK